MLSIIVPNYNHSDFLVRRMESILFQTYDNYEVILLDDNSSDGSLEILNRYVDHPKVSNLLVNDSNSGSPFKQWQKGIDQAEGDLIWIAESDDWAEEKFVESLIDKLTPEVGIAYSRSWTYYEEKQERDSWFYADGLDMNRWKSDFSNSGQDEIDNFLIYRNTIPNASACIFKKKLVEFTPQMLEMKFCGDWLFWAKMLTKTNLAFVSEPLNNFRFSLNTTRAVRSVDLEEKRLDEYFNCIKLINSWRSSDQTLVVQNYDWIINNLYPNPQLYDFFLLKMPRLPIRKLDYLKYNLFRAAVPVWMRFKHMLS